MLDSKLDSILSKYDDIGSKLLDPSKLDSKEFARLSKEYSHLEKIVVLIREYKTTQTALSDATELMNDPEMKDFAEEELYAAKAKLPDLERAIKISLLPVDEADERNAILEIRAGAGGDEAALFVSNMLSLYQRFAQNNGWKFEILALADTGIGGLKECQASITGLNVFSRLKFESGVHRVQRVPDTENQGRIHTSTITVAVLPEVEEVDIQINDADLRIDVYRSSGPGGQSVNTTDSAVRITHLPTGVVVACQDEKSQHKNKAKGMKILRARIYEAERQKKADIMAAERKSQVGTGDRSERIRTYNYPQSRITDHRINMSIHGSIDEIIKAGKIDDLVNALVSSDEAERLLNSEI
jgi:peptide chain release factor 1